MNPVARSMAIGLFGLNYYRYANMLPDSDALRSIREELNYTQEDVAVQANINTRTYQRMEAGRPAKAENLQAVARALSVNVGAIVRSDTEIAIDRYPKLSRGFADREGDLLALIDALSPVRPDVSLQVLETLLSLGVPVHDLYGVSEHTVGIELSAELAAWRATWGVLHVSTDELGEPAGARTLHNREMHMERAGRSRTWTARIPMPKNRGVRFKCFADLEDYDLELARQQLERHFGTDATIGEGRVNRIWFLLPHYRIATDPDGIQDNVIYPA